MNFQNEKDRTALLERLHEDVVQVPSPYPDLPGDCRIPKCRINADGSLQNKYTLMRVNGVNMGRHVVALALKLGVLPDRGLVARHMCDRKGCCESEHLEVGTRDDNRRDAIVRNRIARGLRHGAYTHPECFQRGQKNRMAKITDEIAAGIKWCLAHVDEWWQTERAPGYDTKTAVAIHFNVPVTTVKGVQQDAWNHIAEKRPTELPLAKMMEAGQRPPAPKRKTVLSDADVKQIRVDYYTTTDPCHFVRDMAAKYRVTPASIWNVLKRKTFKHLTPEIPAVNDSGHGMAKYPDEVIQKIRATYDAYCELHGVERLISALSSYTGVSESHTRNIAERASRIEVMDDPAAVIPLDQLELDPMAGRGDRHPLAKLDDEKVFEILRRISAGEKRNKIARENGVSGSLISEIARGKTWKYVFKRFHSKEGQP